MKRSSIVKIWHVVKDLMNLGYKFGAGGTGVWKSFLEEAVPNNLNLRPER